MSTSVTVPNMPKYSFSFSEDVCQLRPPTNNFPGAGSPPLGVERPEDPFWLPFIVGIRPLPCRSWSMSPFPSMPVELQQTKIMWILSICYSGFTAPMAAPSAVCVCHLSHVQDTFCKWRLVSGHWQQWLTLKMKCVCWIKNFLELRIKVLLTVGVLIYYLERHFLKKRLQF